MRANTAMVTVLLLCAWMAAGILPAAAPDAAQAPPVNRGEAEQVPEDIADIPVADLLVNGDAHKRYFLHGPKAGIPAPKRGYKLAIIMPGGDGRADFHWFVTRIYKNALGEDWIAVQPVAVKWDPGQEIVWPTRQSKVAAQGFSTEEFIEDIIADVRKKHPLDERNIITLSWSSSGPAAYAISLQKKKSVTGSFVAMSVFFPKSLPPLANAKGHRYYLLHSPDDQVCKFSLAEQAHAALAKAGAEVKFVRYEGGHGWQGSSLARIREGMAWLARE